MGRGEGGGASGSGGRKRDSATFTPINESPAPFIPPVVQRDYIEMNEETAGEYIRQQYMRRNLSPLELSALDYYQGDEGFAELNRTARLLAKDPDYVPRADAMVWMRRMDAAMRPLEDDLTLYRGFGGRTGDKMIEKFKNGTLIGDSYTDAGYTSASADLFSSFSGRKSVSMEIRAPKGTPSFMTNPYGPYNGEHEIGIHRGAKFRVIEAKMERNAGLAGDQLKVVVEYEGPME